VLPSLVVDDRSPHRPKVAAHVTGSFVAPMDSVGGGGHCRDHGFVCNASIVFTTFLPRVRGFDNIHKQACKDIFVKVRILALFASFTIWSISFTANLTCSVFP